MTADRIAAQVAVNLRSVNTATVSERLHNLAEAADSAVKAVEELARDTSPDRAERLAIHFGGMQRHASMLAESLKERLWIPKV